ncbi:hypothetical protein N7468_002427 [Penicillium chermesinum]|uniref:Exonuclease V n=1 Tax=Penicillium chermesinum TaxID=63820 RepID=A0A9W9PIG9_9EURO|nr:uncharacterized protein N7468_002427 [Penicillium chermesinum]KAJ5247444.1 hypothetical protein N7468_002427 [Penicillium chermesinum]KAJ6145682.1 hypothetical protein N7470_009577 [Penicillium chermesinum]
MSCKLRRKSLDSDSSEYGSDFTPDEQAQLNELLAKADAENARAAAPVSTPATPVAFEDLELLQPVTLSALVADIEDGIDGPPSLRLPKVLGRDSPKSPWRQAQRPTVERVTGRRWAGQGAGYRADSIVEHPSSSEGREPERERARSLELEWTQVEQALPTQDTRTPIERFRRPPNKAFSVTDLVSPAWCELQYWYTLTKHGRKRRTPAMKKGSVVHKALEDEIYTTVPVKIKTKEDAWALRIWNVIQGLRMLRDYGVTRELEVWGMVDGELVNGVIDQLSYECPDSDLEASAAGYYEEATASRAAMPEYQMSLSDYLLSSSQGGRRLSDLSRTEAPAENAPTAADPGLPRAVYDLPRIYMTDVKTKASGSVPTVKSTGFRPTLLQLHLYYHILNRMVTSDDVTIGYLAARYELDLEKPFTDAFISEVGGLNDEFFDTISSFPSQSSETDIGDAPTPDDAQRISQDDPFPPSSHDDSRDSTSLLMTYGTLSRLWGFMKEQIRFTFIPQMSETHRVAPSIPAEEQPALLEDYPTLLSPVLTARFVSSALTEEPQPRLLKSRSFLFDPNNMSSYIADQMEWWRGQRDPRGVDIMEAWKCRICDFRDECSWREEREMEFARRNHNR